MMRTYLPCGLALIVMAVATTAGATTVRRAPVAELAATSDVILHGMVRFVDDHLATSRSGPFLTAVEIEIIEVIKGLDPKTETLRLLLPGGRAFGRTARVPGMPQLQPGEEVVLLLERTELSYIFTGLGQGVFRVEGTTGATPRVFRDLSGMNLVGPTTHGLAFEPTLAGLLGFLRETASQGGDQ